MNVNTVLEQIKLAVDGADLMGTTQRITAMDYAAENPPVPCFEVAEFVLTPHKTMGTSSNRTGMSQLEVTANLLVARGDDEAGQREARALAGTGADSIIGAILDARGANGVGALNDTVDDCYVRTVRGPKLIDYGTVKYYAIEFSLFVVGR